MLEIIALLFLTREIGKLAIAKGLKPMKWKIYLILAWIFFELWGFMVALLFFDVSNLFSIMMVGFMFAITGYFWIKGRLNRMPDNGYKDDIDQLGK